MNTIAKRRHTLITQEMCEARCKPLQKEAERLALLVAELSSLSVRSILSEKDMMTLAALIGEKIEQHKTEILELRIKRVVNHLFENDGDRNMPPMQNWWNDVTVRSWYHVDNEGSQDGEITVNLASYVGDGETEEHTFTFPKTWVYYDDSGLSAILAQSLQHESDKAVAAQRAQARMELEQARRRLKELGESPGE